MNHGVVVAQPKCHAVCFAADTGHSIMRKICWWYGKPRVVSGKSSLSVSERYGQVVISGDRPHRAGGRVAEVVDWGLPVQRSLGLRDLNAGFCQFGTKTALVEFSHDSPLKFVALV